MIYQHLFDRVQEPKTVRAGLIGAGDFGTPIVTQAPLVPRLEIPIVADVNLEAGRSAFRQAGYTDDDIVVCDSRAAALRAMEAGQAVVVPDGMLLMDLPLHVIATATRSAEAGARFAREAIRHGKHVVMIDKEADAVVGPLLKRLADQAGVVYTTDDGDQIGLLMGLISWAGALGMEILCGGMLHSFILGRDTATVSDGEQTVRVPEEDRWVLGRIPAGEAVRYHQARHRLLAGLQMGEQSGDTVCHLAVIANGTGLLPDVGMPVGHLPVVRLAEIPEVLCPVEEGGVLQRRGAVDTATLLRGADEPHGGGGVYAVVANADPHSRATMIEKGLYANSRGTAMLIYRPFHLCGAETAMSMLCAGLLGVPTGSSSILPQVDMAARATRDLRAGEAAGNPQARDDEPLGYSRHLTASLVPAAPLAGDRPLPYFMLEDTRLVQDVPAGTVLTAAMVESPQGSLLWSLRREQDKVFFGDDACEEQQ